jgi:lysozyme family protein
VSSFDRALPFVLRMEGGYSNHPSDPGGATNKGITQKTYDEWTEGRGGGTRSVREITDAEVYAIYKTRYWDAARCDALPWPLALCHFDAAVNHGVRNAIKLLQRALGVDDDGIFGPKTQAALNAADPDALFGQWYAARLKFYYDICQGRPASRVFLLGWVRRLVHLNEAIAA